MPLKFTFALSQQQTFELRCDYGLRRLDKTELAALMDLCEQNYYAQQVDRLPYLTQLGRQLYQWLDGKEGWLRKALDEADEQTIYLDLIQTSEAQGLNPETERVALGLAHLPWELLHNGSGFLMERRDISVLPVRSVQQRQTQVIGVQNRPLRLLFMATSPEDPKVPLLEFEREEANILQATKDQPLALIVEESGSVAELANLVKSYPEDYFDVFHLTGHGIIYTKKSYSYLLPKGVTLADNTPCFITEDEVGNLQLTTVNDLAKAFRGRWPRVTFLSGCHTGQVPNQGTVPSMAQALVKAGAGIVLGWARPVYDKTGIVAAQALYQALATGASVEAAVKAAQLEMIDKECTDWHLLRMYRDTRPIAELVTPLRTKHREKLKFTAPEQEFLDEHNLVKVASQFEFVGRRRHLQRCLRALRETSDQIGVFIAGMGGLGKSTLAARLCTRVQAQRPNFARVVLIGVLDEWGLLNKLSNKYERFADVPALLNEPKVSLKGRLQNFFEAIEQEHNQPLLLVLDDFEQNIPTANIEDGSLRMTTGAYEILAAICAALAETGAESRLIVTCRYLKSDTLPPHRLHLESLAGMNSSDIDKICFPLDKEVRQQLRTQRILKIADGNPRLLKWLLDVVQQPGLAADELLNRLEATEQKFRENILAQTLLDGLEVEERKFLARLSVFHLPVTEEIINAISPTSPPLQKLVSLSLVESATTYATQPANYRVTTILEPLLEAVLSEEEWQVTRQQAVKKIRQAWWEENKNPTEAETLEIVRLGLLAKEQEIAVSIGDRIANNWVNNSRFVEALDLCEQVLAVFQDYRILGTVALAEAVLGFVQEAVTRYEQALDLCPEENLERKAAILNNMAEVIAQQGDIIRAIALWEQSLEISEQIDEVKGKATTLNNMARIIAQQGDIIRAIALWEQDLEISEQIGDVQGKATTLNNMARIIAQQGDIAKAIALWEQSLEISEQIGDVKGKATTLSNMAVVFRQQGDITKAIALWEQSLEIFEQIGDVKGKATTLNNMAVQFAHQGDIARAIALWEQSLEIFEQIGDVKGKATTLNNMAVQFAHQGDIARAIALWEQSLEIDEQIGDVKGKATTLNNMGQIIAHQGDIARAIALWQQSLEIQQQIGDVQGKATTLGNMARIIAHQGDIARAIALYEQSLEIFEQIGNVEGKATTLSNMAQVIADQGDIARAIALYEQSLEIQQQIGDVQGKATTLGNMARIIAHQGDIARAIALYEQSLEIFEQIGNVEGKATTLSNMAQVIADQGDIARAIALYKQSLEIFEQIGNVKGKATTLSNMAQQFAHQGDIARAIALWEQSLEIFEQIGDVQGKAATLSNMAQVIAQQGDITKAIALWEEVASTLAQVRAYSDLVTVLSNLGVADESKSLVYLAQAMWLTLKIQAPLADTIYLIRALYDRVPQGDELKALLGTTAMFFCNYRGEGHPQLEELQESSFKIVLGAASVQGIETEEAFDNWFVQQRLNDPDYFLPRLNQRLEEIVGDGWLFDPSQVVGG
ncbi:tetratricopeptide repeat protein [Calothrix sp. PCC 7507]|uniref:tetratricopeptide repeat protein n=1 Tax=Calothrix sp. PCC 7507 TaxID=99598 RepID=UPI00029F2578|nr:tetratricopeptide repeat protein [Calothrix sp. PCC 7507]AFY35460.1 Tetratricopeptide TPR_2 repeat-containing protein [Calothrix sp. PCC 7507]